jgi:HAD superfamily hydrolase (TIGR01509 family)
MKIEVPEYIKGLIFDCDGTLVDSMPLHMKAWEYAVTECGLKWDFDFFFSKKGMPGEDILKIYSHQFGIRIDEQKIIQVKRDYFSKHKTEFQPIKHVVEIAHRYKDILPMAVASGGTRDTVLLQLDDIGIRNYFKAIVTADDNVKPKPEPDVFLKAARQIGVPPELCQVFEDGDLGLEAARRAGMHATDIRLDSEQ